MVRPGIREITLAIGIGCLLGAGLSLPLGFLLCVIAVLPWAGWFVLKNPFLLSLGFICFSYFRLHEAFLFLEPFKLPQLLALGSLTSLAWNVFVAKTLKPSLQKAHGMLFLFTLWVFVSVMMATSRGLAMGMFTGSFIKIFIMTFAVSWLITQPRHLKIACHAFIFSGVAVALVAISNKLNGIGLIEGTRVTISREMGSQIGDPNDLSLVLMFPVSFAAAYLFAYGKSMKMRLFYLIALGLLAWAVVATQSRGGLLGLCTVVGYCANQRIKNKALLISIGAVALSILLVLAGISDRKSGGAAEEGIDESAMGRIYAWQAAWGMALANPFTGVGLDNFYENYYFYSPHWDGKNHAVHSTWFQVLAETGFVGLILFVSLIVVMVKVIRRCSLLVEAGSTERVMLTALGAGVAGFVVAGTFLTQGFTWPLYILLGLTLALAWQLQKKQQAAQKTQLEGPNVHLDSTSKAV